MPIYSNVRYEFLIERRDYGRQVCLAVVDYQFDADEKKSKMQPYKLVPNGEPMPENYVLSGCEDLSMILTEEEARSLATALANAGIRPY